MIQEGRYTLVYNNGEYRTLQIEEGKNDFAGKFIVSLKVGPGQSWRDYKGCGFLSADNKVSFWRSFKANNDQARLDRIQSAVDRIARNPKEAGMAFAMQSGRCCRCGRELTVPASIHAGVGPDCAEKYGWEKADNKAVHEHLAVTRTLDTNFADSKSAAANDSLGITEEDIRTVVAPREAVPPVPTRPAAPSSSLPAKIQEKAAKATAKTNANAQILRMVAFKKANDTKSFYDPFGIDEQLTEAAAVNFWAKRFQATPLDDDRFWGDEAGRAEQEQESAAFLADMREQEDRNERAFVRNGYDKLD